MYTLHQYIHIYDEEQNKCTLNSYLQKHYCQRYQFWVIITNIRTWSWYQIIESFEYAEHIEMYIFIRYHQNASIYIPNKPKRWQHEQLSLVLRSYLLELYIFQTPENFQAELSKSTRTTTTKLTLAFHLFFQNKHKDDF